MFQQINGIFQMEPKTAHENSRKKWSELGPFPLVELISKGIIKWDKNLELMFSDSFNGQTETGDILHGIGRYIDEDGIYEGYFDTSRLNGYGRVIYIASVYEGYFKNDKKIIHS